MQCSVFVTDLQTAVLLSEGQQPVHVDLHSVIQHVLTQDIAGEEAGHSVVLFTFCTCCILRCLVCIVIRHLVCIVVILCVFVVLCVYCCFYFRCRAAG